MHGPLQIETTIRKHVERMESAESGHGQDDEAKDLERCGPVGKDELMEELRKWKVSKPVYFSFILAPLVCLLA